MAAAALKQLLDQLATADRLSERLRIVRQSYDLIRSLSPHEREKIAMKVGSQWAWRHLEKLLARDGELGEADELARGALEQLGDSDPRELLEAARAAKRGELEGLKRFAVDALREATAGESQQPPAVLEPWIEVESAPEPTAPEPAAAQTEPEPIELEPVAAPEPVEAAPVPEPPRATPPPETSWQRLDWDMPQPSTAKVGAPERRPASEQAPFDTARARLAALRRLREEPGHAERLGREGRARLLLRLGGGWPARRAVSELIRSGSFDDLDEALASIERLDTPARRAWCLGDLLERGALDERAAERILAAAPSPAARRRLERRQAARSRAPR
jgi:hypothetical protein